MTENPNRPLLLASGGVLVLAAVLLWGGSRFTWVLLQSFDGLGEPKTVAVSGAMWSSALVPMAVALVAAAAATLAVRGWPLRVLAVLVAVVGAGAAYLGVGMWAVRDVGLRAAELASVPVHTLVGAERHYGGAVTVLVAAALTVIASALLMRAGRGSAASKYRTPAARRADAAESGSGLAESAPEKGQRERLMWDLLDDGRDPTDESDGS